MFKLILFIIMCLCTFVSVVVGLFCNKTEDVKLQRVNRICWVLIIAGILFQRYALDYWAGYKTDGLLAVPAGMGANLLVCAGIVCVVYFARWLWTGKWS